MSIRSVAADGDAPSPDVVRLLRLLSRRAAGIPHAAVEAQAGGALAVVAGTAQLGAVSAAAWHQALAQGLVRIVGDGCGRITPDGLALVRRLASGLGGPEDASATAATTTSAPIAPAAAANGEADPRNVPQQPGFNADESPLAWLARRRDKSGRPLIEPRQLEAGERFRADFHFAQMSPRVTANWSLDAPGSRRGVGGGALDLRDNVVAAQERVRRALAAVGPELSGVLVDVCGHLKGLEQAERGNGWPARSGKVILQLALQALARHYGIAGDARSGGACRHWGSTDYRPRIDS